MIPMPYGKGTLSITAPARYSVAVPEAMKPDSSGIDSDMLVLGALDAPIGRPPLDSWLKQTDRCVVVVPDATRMSSSARYLKILDGKLRAAGVSPGNVKIVVAVGNHRRSTDAEIEKIVGTELVRKYKVVNHESKRDLVSLGVTQAGTKVEVNRAVAEADKVLLTGAAAFHIFAGYSGGRKSLLPGVCASETILHNHSLMFKGKKADRRAAMGVLKGNPVHEDMVEALGIFGTEKVFLLNVVCDSKGAIIGAFAGAPLKAHRAACSFVSGRFSVEYDHGFDLIVMSSGGFPFDNSFYQAYKGAYCLLDALNVGGSLVVLAECPEGYGEKAENTDFWFSKTTSQLLDHCSDNFDMNGKVAFDIRQISVKCGQSLLVTRGDERMVEIAGMERLAEHDVDSKLAELIAEREKAIGGYPEILFVPYGTWTLVRNRNGAADYSIPE
jgi:nickel-dependent lactate racemase